MNEKPTQTTRPRNPYCPSTVRSSLHKGIAMLNLLGSKQRFCDGLNRRNFLKIGAFGAGLALSDMLLLRAQANPGTGSRPTSPKAAIMIYLPGGPSHMDMYDL